MKRVFWLIEDLADRIFPLLAVCGLLLSIGLLGSADDARQAFWALCALALACVAMWAFWEN